MNKKNKNNFTNDQLLKFYEKMFLIRKFEEKAAQLYGAGKIGGFCHLYIGQEAVVIGILSSINSEDTVITAYRDHGHIFCLLYTSPSPRDLYRSRMPSSA